jgi:hypothetical protein
MSIGTTQASTFSPARNRQSGLPSWKTGTPDAVIASPSDFRPHAPDTLQVVPLAWIYPSPDNVRLIVEGEKLNRLVALYRKHMDRPELQIVLPDAPVVRYRGPRGDGTPRLECLAGERRLTAASLAGIRTMAVRSSEMTDEEAYQFIPAHNDVKPLTTIELAYRAAEMERLGFSDVQIAEGLGGIGVHRYLDVGRLIDPTRLTNTEKLCDPTITSWHEAFKLGEQHFLQCLRRWDAGEWNEHDCIREFRRKGRVLPSDNAERGIRVTKDRNRLILRGQVDLDIHDSATAEKMLAITIEHLEYARTQLSTGSTNFSARKELVQINPLTV